VLYAACVGLSFAVAVALAPTDPLALITLTAIPLAVAAVRLVLTGTSSRDLIAALGQTGRLQLAFGALLTAGMAIRI
jgi:1,4-dihydroxy-2-naphthoate polyprenyltransferase